MGVWKESGAAAWAASTKALITDAWALQQVLVKR